MSDRPALARASPLPCTVALPENCRLETMSTAWCTPASSSVFTSCRTAKAPLVRMPASRLCRVDGAACRGTGARRGPSSCALPRNAGASFRGRGGGRPHRPAWAAEVGRGGGGMRARWAGWNGTSCTACRPVTHGASDGCPAVPCSTLRWCALAATMTGTGRCMAAARCSHALHRRRQAWSSCTLARRWASMASSDSATAKWTPCVGWGSEAHAPSPCNTCRHLRREVQPRRAPSPRTAPTAATWDRMAGESCPKRLAALFRDMAGGRPAACREPVPASPLLCPYARMRGARRCCDNSVRRSGAAFESSSRRWGAKSDKCWAKRRAAKPACSLPCAEVAPLPDSKAGAAPASTSASST